MSASKPQKAPEDVIYEEVDDYNKTSFRSTAEKELVKSNKEAEKPEKEILLKADTQKYAEAFRNYYYSCKILNDAKSNEFFEEAIREVHPSIKLKNPTKDILKLVNKVFVQQLAETCFEVISKTRGEEKFKDVDQEVVEDAYRLMERRRVKNTKFARLFTDSV